MGVWTEEKELFLAQNYTTMTADEMEQTLNLSRSSVYLHLKNMGLDPKDMLVNCKVCGKKLKRGKYICSSKCSEEYKKKHKLINDGMLRKREKDLSDTQIMLIACDLLKGRTIYITEKAFNWNKKRFLEELSDKLDVLEREINKRDASKTKELIKEVKTEIRKTLKKTAIKVKERA